MMINLFISLLLGDEVQKVTTLYTKTHYNQEMVKLF